MKKRSIVLLAIIASLLVMACSLSDIGPRQQARTTATPTRTPRPTFTPPATATRTLTPSSTPIPTNTATVTPRPSSTPVPSDTPPPSDTPTQTAIPTLTETPPPSATPTATRRPTARPTRRPTTPPTPRPTQTPPPPFTGKIVRGDTNCGGYAGVTGYVRHASGDPYPGVAIGVWNDIWQGRVAISEPDGKFEITLSDLPPDTFRVAAVRLETCGQRDGQPTAVDCQRISNVIENVSVTEKCTGAGANQVTTIDFTGP
jgi:hypothetical protein